LYKYDVEKTLVPHLLDDNLIPDVVLNDASHRGDVLMVALLHVGDLVP
jgi:hypothetical protein